VSAKFHTLLEQLAGESDSMLSARLDALQDKIAKNQEQADRMQALLDSQTTALYTKFYNMESAIAKLQNSLTVVNSIEPLSIYTNSNSSNSSS
jgi:flagellar capping protein FliD